MSASKRAVDVRAPSLDPLSGPSKSEQAAKAIKSMTIETVFKIQKIIQLTLAPLMVILAILKLVFMVSVTVPGFMISAFFALFAVMFIFVELNIKKSRTWFSFLNNSLGKGLFHFFLFFLCYSSAVTPVWVEILMSVVFAITAIVFFIMYCFFKNQEGPFIERLIN